jgi:hypothetical protein
VRPAAAVRVLDESFPHDVARSCCALRRAVQAYKVRALAQNLGGSNRLLAAPEAGPPSVAWLS